MGYLIDTSVLIAWERQQSGKWPPSSKPFGPRDRQASVALSVITVSELLHGVHRASTAQQRGKREAFVEALLAATPVVGIDAEVARMHARIWADLQRHGSLIGAHDLWIAATALVHGLKVATCNVRDFAKVPELFWELW